MVFPGAALLFLLPSLLTTAFHCLCMRPSSRDFNYTGLVDKVYGKRGRLAVAASMFLLPSALCAYIMVGDTVTRAFYLAEDGNVLKDRNFIIPLCGFLIVLPLSSLPKCPP